MLPFSLRSRVPGVLLALTAGLAAVLPAGQPAVAEAATAATAPASSASADPFYTYDGPDPLDQVEPGAVLKTRTLRYHVAGVPTPLEVVQLLYRSTDQQGRPVANVTSVIRTPVRATTQKVISYQSFYDSLDPEHGPSRVIAGGLSLGGSIATVETALIAPFLLQGYAVVVTDTEGPGADFAAGPEYGRMTLDGLRAALSGGGTGIAPGARIGLVGYSGGAIATNWAAALATSYAPEVAPRIVGAAEGGVLVSPAHNLRYIDGSAVWAGVMAMAVVGVGRAFGIDLTPYLSDRGRQVYQRMQRASIAQVLGQYPGLTWAELAKPAYAVPESIPEYVDAVNRLNLGAAPTPDLPMMIGQGTAGYLEGTRRGGPGIGPGDGVMIAGDVRSLARQYCDDGTPVLYREYALGSHFASVPTWMPQAVAWLQARFGGATAPDNCATIAPGNSLAPVTAP